MIKRIRRLSFYLKLSIIFCLICFAILLFYSLIYSQLASSSLEKEALKRVEVTSSLITQRLSYQIQESDYLSSSLILSSIVQKELSIYHNLDYLERRVFAHEMNTILRSYARSNPQISGILLRDNEGNEFDSWSNLEPKLLDQSRFRELKASNKKEILSLKGLSLRIGDQMVSSLIAHSYPIFDMNTGEKIGSLAILFDLEQVRFNLFYEQEQTDIKQCLIVLENQEKILLFPSSSASLPSSNLLEKVQAEPIKREGEYLFIKATKSRQTTIIMQVHLTELAWQEKKLSQINTIMTLSAILLILLIIPPIARRLLEPLRLLSKAISSFAQGNSNIHVHVNNEDELGLVVTEFNKMVASQKAMQAQIEREQRQKLQYSYEILQAQINPHFLYNSLETICGLAEQELKEETISMINHLSSFYHRVLSEGEFLISIKEELDLCSHYLKILQIRYDYSFAFEIDCPEELKSYHCLKLVMQPIVENAIFHGLIASKKKEAKIKIKVRKKDAIYIKIRDNGLGIPKAKLDSIKAKLESKNQEESISKEGFGLYNINERIKLFFGKSYGLFIESEAGKYCQVTIKIGQKDEV